MAAARRPVLCLVVDRTLSRRPLAEAVEAAVSAGVDWIQLRDRTLEGADWLDWGSALAGAARRSRPPARVLVNRRLDIAMSLMADGLAQGAHLGFDALPLDVARALLGESAEIGTSAHHPDEVSRAAEAGATYAQLAPIFDPISKPAQRPALGSLALQRAAGSGIPVLAQGGIDASRCAEVIERGAAGIAVTGAILMADDPGEAAARLRRALDEGAP